MIEQNALTVTLEALGVLFGGGIALAKLRPQLIQAVVFFQVAYTLTQLYSLWVKNFPRKSPKPHNFLHEITDHYFKTHPKGKKMAGRTDADEKLEEELVG